MEAESFLAEDLAQSENEQRRVGGHDKLHAWEHLDELWEYFMLIPCVKVQVHLVNDDEPTYIFGTRERQASVLSEVEVAQDRKEKGQ